jgi:putative hydrolase of the HAD superfamily
MFCEGNPSVIKCIFKIYSETCKMKKCIIWDFDNTLAYRNGMWTATICNILEQNGYHCYDKARIREILLSGLPWHIQGKAHKEYFNGLGWWDHVNLTISKAFKESCAEDAKNREMTLAFRDEYLKKSEWHIYDDTVPALEKSKEMGFENIILSNHTPELEELVCALGIKEYFVSVITSAVVGYEKPDKRIFAEAVKNNSSSSFVMVGDNYDADIAGALDFGIDAVLVRKTNEHGYAKYSEDLTGIWRHME